MLLGRRKKTPEKMFPEAPDTLNDLLAALCIVGDKFPKNDFIHDFFYAMAIGNYSAYLSLRDVNIIMGNEINVNFTDIKDMNEEKALDFIKLCSAFFLFAFQLNQDNIKFLATLDITPDILEEYLQSCMQFTNQDINLYNDLKERFFSDHASYSMGFYRAMAEKVLGNSENVDIVKATCCREMMSIAHREGFLAFFNRAK